MQEKRSQPNTSHDHPNKRIEVDISRQVLTAYDRDQQVYQFHCATGDKANRTPTGRFAIYRKEEKYVSHQYHRRMDYAMFFNRGVAIHEAYMVEVVSYLKYFGLDDFGSHGCVRLASEDAKRLFRWAPLRTPVEVK